MAAGTARRTRKLRNWVVEQVESGEFPGVCWDDAEKTMFRIPWKHAGKQDFRENQDAAFFKAWAKFKGKYQEGDPPDPAGWKTRLRCALNKSPEFEKVLARSHLDGAEPYKVYRLLPPGEPPAQSQSRKRQPKRGHKTPSSEEEDDEEEGEEEAGGAKRSRAASPVAAVSQSTALRLSGSPDLGSRHLEDSGIGSDSNSPEPAGVPDATEVVFQGFTEPSEVYPSPETDHFPLLTIAYSGHPVHESLLRSPDFHLSAGPSLSGAYMSHVVLPPAEALPESGPREATRRLLEKLDRGIMVASNVQGLFVKSLCPSPVSWSGPGTGSDRRWLPQGGLKHLFDATLFREELDQFRQGLRPRPEFQVTLDFWEERSGPNHTPQNLITVKLEQTFARHLLEGPEEQTAAMTLLQSLGAPLPPTLPALSLPCSPLTFTLPPTPPSLL
ncbi:interferon regulatory factor 9 [Ornithorhynchus anatinus]|uniref:interferon regulatory factor 9 n=1 Tax=Ornithorhynchus anatinus TaxID=9258 RepID=UPI0010A8C152|nr:interferon regulatory factor 9 [Ornithorhynchus anatinus]XP_028934201.1 interferon regulatory factor 9 [Ornithorhynchus anatinus]